MINLVKNKLRKNKLHLILLVFVLVVVAVVIAKRVIVSKPVKENPKISFYLEPTITPEYKVGVLELEENFIPTFSNVLKLNSMEDIQKYLYTIDPTAYVERQDLDLQGFISQNVKTELIGNEPKILIFHTHSQETFKDSEEGNIDDTIVGMGRKLGEILVKKYKVPVVHDTGQYDMVDGKVTLGNSYERMEVSINKVLEKYPSIEVTIDLHRDGVPEDRHLITEVNGKPTAQIMFFNGVSKENKDGQMKELPSLYNPFLYENLALSLQLQLTANELYPDFARKLYLKAYRYSLHLKPRSMLIELGANTNTVSEAENALDPLAEILYKTLEIHE